MSAAEGNTIVTDTGAKESVKMQIRHEWYQTNDEVNVSVFVKNVKAEDLHVDLQARSLSMTIKLATGSEFVFDLDPLAHEIDVARSSHRVLSTKIEVRLAKTSAGVKWTKLEGEDEAAGSMTNSASPARTGFSKRNWDKIEREAVEEENKSADLGKDPNAGGDKELNKLFQKLYKDATPDQQRAMMKSYQESNGTSLSTNWDDVKKKKVETIPPDSMVAKPWNG